MYKKVGVCEKNTQPHPTFTLSLAKHQSSHRQGGKVWMLGHLHPAAMSQEVERVVQGSQGWRFDPRLFLSLSKNPKFLPTGRLYCLVWQLSVYVNESFAC